MLIDFHTHVFPDKIAKDSCDKMARSAGVTYYGNGTLAGLLVFMKEDGVDISVNAPVATKPEQVLSINRKMVELNNNSKSVVNLAAMHPGFTGFDEEMAFLKANGIKGIKLHPEYQQFYPEDKKMFPLYEACAKNNIFILFHSGIDLGYTSVHCTPNAIKQVLSVKGLKMIFAHMGAFKMWDEVEKLMVGEDVYFDLAYCSEMNDAQLKRIILKHGSHKILFASDFPWERPSTIKEKLVSIGLPQQDLDNICFKNASKLLGIKA